MPTPPVSLAPAVPAHAPLLQVPMRYAIHCVGSRSTIRDDVLRPGEQFPLFSKSQDRQRFVVAVRFLQLNITQVRGGRAWQAAVFVPRRSRPPASPASPPCSLWRRLVSVPQHLITLRCCRSCLPCLPTYSARFSRSRRGTRASSRNDRTKYYGNV